MNNVNKLKFTLDNIIYNCIVKDNEDIQIILPMRVPTATVYIAKATKEKSVVLSPTERIEIVIYFNVIADTIPTIEITGECKESKISFSGDISVLSPKSKTAIHFVTTDGGRNWLISQQIFGDGFKPTDAVMFVNGKSGNTIVLTANDIMLSDPIEGNTIISIQKQLERFNNKLNNIKSEVTNEMIELVPDIVDNALSGMTINAEAYKI